MTVREPHPAFLRRMFSPVWADVAPLVQEIEGTESEPLDRDRARTWSLVLSSRRVPHRVRREGEAASVLVPAGFADRAAYEISQYIVENRADPAPEPVREMEGDHWPAIFTALLLLAFYAFYNQTFASLGLYPGYWLEYGMADAGKIMDGQWWRAITALTLHADPAHVLGNALIGGVFLALASRRLGAGPALFLTVVSGVLGNFVNAWVLGASHLSIGFSTAVFGAAGLLAGLRAASGEGLGFRKAFVPVAAGLGLLATLGSGGENTDLGAHLFGFGAGLALGMGAGLVVRRCGALGPKAGHVLLAATLALPVASWIVAWG